MHIIIPLNRGIPVNDFTAGLGVIRWTMVRERATDAE